MEIGISEVNDISWKNIDRLVEATQQVTSEDIQAVIKKYLIDDYLTVAILDPQPLVNTTVQSAVPGMRH